MRPLAAFACALLALCAPLAAGDHAKDVERLLEGVQLMPPAGYPGWIAIVGAEAFPVVVGREGDYDQAVVAAAEHGSGRIVLFGHNGYAAPGSWDGGDGWKLLENCVRWATRNERTKPRVGVWNNAPMAEALTKHGLQGESFGDFARLDKGLKFDALLFSPWDFAPEHAEKLAKYVKGGGAILCGETGWGWSQYNGAMAKNGGNKLFGPMGLVFSDGIAHGRGADGFRILRDPSPWLNAQTALDALLAKDPPPGFGPKESRQAAWSVSQAMRLLPENDKLLRPRFAKLRGRPPVVPSPEQPLRASSTLDRILLGLQIEEAFALPAIKVKALPAAASFPGPVDGAAPRITKLDTVNAAIHDWRSTGLYAAPGELVEITLPPEHVKQGWRVQLGAHVDDTAHHGDWLRAPRVAGSWPLDEATTKVASAFGGLVYLLPGDKAGGSVQVKIRGALEAPRFVAGKTAGDEWARQRALAGPWAEIETSSIVLTVPAHEIRELGDPEALAAKWDAALGALADLAGLSARARPERFVVDVQTSNGGAHAGYPCAAPLEAAPLLLDPSRWRGEAMGAFRELARNHQSPYWTFEGSGEALTTFFALRALEVSSGKAVDDEPAYLQGSRDERWKNHVSEHEASFDRWKNDASLAILLWIDVQQEYGWEPFEKVFREFRAQKEHEKAKTDDEKRDQWLVRLSRACNADLGFLFAAWGVPVSDAARAALNGLRPWEPENRRG